MEKKGNPFPSGREIQPKNQLVVSQIGRDLWTVKRDLRVLIKSES